MHEPDDDEAPPASTRVLRVRRLGEVYAVFAGDEEASAHFATREEAVAAARVMTGDRGGLILVEGESGFEAEAVPPSSIPPSSARR